jgi:hypothetical protein
MRQEGIEDIGIKHDERFVEGLLGSLFTRSRETHGFLDVPLVRKCGSFSLQTSLHISSILMDGDLVSYRTSVTKDGMLLRSRGNQRIKMQNQNHFNTKLGIHFDQQIGAILCGSCFFIFSCVRPMKSSLGYELIDFLRERYHQGKIETSLLGYSVDQKCFLSK